MEDMDQFPDLFTTGSVAGKAARKPALLSDNFKAYSATDVIAGSSHRSVSLAKWTTVWREAMAPTSAAPWADWKNHGEAVWKYCHTHRSLQLMADMMNTGINANGLILQRHMLMYLVSMPRYWLTAAKSLLSTHNLESDAMFANPVMHDVVKSGHVECADGVILPVNKHTYTAKQLISCFANDADVELLGTLMQHSGVDIDIADEQGNTALHYAAYHGHYLGAKFLVERGATVDTENKQHLAPIHIAAQRRHDTIVQLLANHEATWIMPHMVWTVAVGGSDQYQQLPINAHETLIPCMQRTVANLKRALEGAVTAGDPEPIQRLEEVRNVATVACRCWTYACVVNPD
jgi:hypothetical protein